MPSFRSKVPERQSQRNSSKIRIGTSTSHWSMRWCASAGNSALISGKSSARFHEAVRVPALLPGPGVGGHCIPIDPNYLSYEVKRQLGRPFRFIELAQEINESMPRYVVDRLQDALNDAGKPVRGSRVLILGITYKPNIADQRQSPAKPIATLLARKGALLTFHDPLVDAWGGVDGGVAIPRVDDLLTAVSQSDAVLLLQAHRKYDVDDLTKRSQLFFDTRGASTHPPPPSGCETEHGSSTPASAGPPSYGYRPDSLSVERSDVQRRSTTGTLRDRLRRRCRSEQWRLRFDNPPPGLFRSDCVA